MSDVIRVFLCLAAAGAAFLSVHGWLFHLTVGPTHGAGSELGIIGGLCSVGLATVALRWRERDDRSQPSTERTTGR
jgi:hypothetical protein